MFFKIFVNELVLQKFRVMKSNAGFPDEKTLDPLEGAQNLCPPGDDPIIPPPIKNDDAPKEPLMPGDGDDIIPPPRK